MKQRLSIHAAAFRKMVRNRISERNLIHENCKTQGLFGQTAGGPHYRLYDIVYLPDAPLRFVAKENHPICYALKPHEWPKLERVAFNRFGILLL